MTIREKEALREGWGCKTSKYSNGCNMETESGYRGEVTF